MLDAVLDAGDFGTKKENLNIPKVQEYQGFLLVAETGLEPATSGL